MEVGRVAFGPSPDPELTAVSNAMIANAAWAEARLSRNDAGSIGSHWEGCWRSEDHHACAVARCERLELERAHARRWARLRKKFARKMWRQNRVLTRKGE